MATRRYKPEQIMTLLRQIEVEIANGKITPQACKEAQITVQKTTFFWPFIAMQDAAEFHESHLAVLRVQSPFLPSVDMTANREISKGRLNATRMSSL